MRSFGIGRRVLFASLASFALVACGLSSSDDARSEGDENLDEQKTIIKPDGSDFPGKFKLVAPTGSPAEAKVTIGSLSGAVGAEIGPLAVGSGRSFSLVSAPFTTIGTSPPIVSNQVSVSNAALLKVDIKNAPQPTLGISTDYGGYYVPGYRKARRWSGTAWEYVSNALPLDWDGTKPVAVLPGKYLLRFGIDDGQVFEVAADATKSVKIWDYPTRRVAKVKAPVRELPTATCASDTATAVKAPRYTIYDTSSGGSLSYSPSVVLQDGAESVEWGIYSEVAAATTQTFYILGYDQEVKIPFGQLGQGPLTTQIGRLDVEDVAVAGPSGTTMVRGSYKVHRKTGTDTAGNDVFSSSSNICGSSAPTHTGFDLPRGRYKVVITYSTVEAGTKTQTHVVDVE